MRSSRSALIAVAVLAAGPVVHAQEQPAQTISLYIFEARVRSFSPGIDAVVDLSEEQKTKLGEVYSAIFGTNAALLANLVLQDSNASVVQRQIARATVLQAQAEFRSKSREVFTEEQRALIDKVYEAFSNVYKAAEEAMLQEVKGGLAAQLEGILTPEQKQAMEKRKAEIESAAAAANTQPEGGDGGGTK